jgi:hypothetical protein
MSTPEEAAINVEAARERMQAQGIFDVTTVTQPPAKAPRARRRDAGTKRPPKPADAPQVAAGGFLDEYQVAHLDKLREDYFQAIEANTKAERAMLDASAAWYGYLDELKAGAKAKNSLRQPQEAE